VRFIEIFLWAVFLCLFLGTNERILSAIPLVGALGLNLWHREMISRKLSKQESDLSQLRGQLTPLLTEAKEGRTLEGQNSSIVQVDSQLTLVEFEKRVAQLESRNEQLNEIQTLFGTQLPQSQTQETINQLLEHIRTIRPHTYELVWDMEASHEILIEALDSFQYRLILVNPWLSEYVFTPGIKHKFKDALKRPNARIFIGWGFWGGLYDKKSFNSETKVELDRFEFKKLSDQKADGPNRVTWKYKALNWLSDLEKESLGKLTLKLLYTHQKYLVCDNQSAMIGSHNFLASKPSKSEHGRSPDAEVGIRTTDPALIKEIVNKYGEARNWDLHTHHQ
jgi:phosphatidylserine/phosphatidylglycerophosphate/cardiolipin synthase-like enzyme